MPWVGYTWMLKYVEQDWPWSTMALKPSSKFDENGKKMDEQTRPGEMYAMLNFKLAPDGLMKYILLKINGEFVKEMRLCVSFDDIRED